MSDWRANALMEWDGQKVSDHGRSALTQDTERIGSDKRMADGTLRRFHVGIKRKWSVEWTNLPSTNNAATGMKTADGGMSGEEMEAFYNNPVYFGKFRMALRRGSAIGLATPNPDESLLPYQDDNFYIVNVMISSFNKEIIKRGNTDLWLVSVSLEEV